MTVISDTQIVPRPPPVPPGAARRRPGRGRRPGVRPLRQHQARLRRPVEAFRRMVRRVGPALPAGPTPHHGPLPGGPRRLRRHIATLRLVSSAITKAQECAGHETPGKDRGVRASLKRWGRRLAKPQRQAGALTADVLAVIRLTAPKPRARGRGFETAEQAAERARFDLALVAVLSDGGCGAARRRR